MATDVAASTQRRETRDKRREKGKGKSGKWKVGNRRWELVLVLGWGFWDAYGLHGVWVIILISRLIWPSHVDNVKQHGVCVIFLSLLFYGSANEHGKRANFLALSTGSRRSKESESESELELESVSESKPGRNSTTGKKFLGRRLGFMRLNCTPYCIAGIAMLLSALKQLATCFCLVFLFCTLSVLLRSNPMPILSPNSTQPS